MAVPARPDNALSPVIAPGQTYASITEAISAIPLHRRFGRSWLAGFAVALVLALLLTFGIGWLLALGVGIWGHQHSGRLEFRDRRLRVVDRDRHGRHIYLGRALPAAQGLAHLAQSLRGRR